MESRTASSKSIAMVAPIGPGAKSKLRGFTYVGVLVLVAIISLMALLSLRAGSVVSRIQAEEELLRVGDEYRTAVLRYSLAYRGGARQFPSKLSDLLRDPRLPQPTRYLRELYPDPITGQLDWELVLTKDGSGFVGVRSASEMEPVKVGNFPAQYVQFENSRSYKDWTFVVAE